MTVEEMLCLADAEAGPRCEDPEYAELRARILAATPDKAKTICACGAIPGDGEGHARSCQNAKAGRFEFLIAVLEEANRLNYCLCPHRVSHCDRTPCGSVLAALAAAKA